MRKLIVSALIGFILLLWIPMVSESNQINSDSMNEMESSDDIKVIPDEAIRLRILANSDNEKDQDLKHKVRDEVNASISEWVEDLTDIDEARRLIEENIPDIRKLIKDVLKEEGRSQEVEVEYGDNVTFPAKLYGSYLYPPGEYEAVLITLGDGEGSNWWCVLFPPLCFLDFSGGSTVEEKDETADAASEEDKQEEKKKEQDDDKEEADVEFFLFDWFD